MADVASAPPQVDIVFVLDTTGSMAATLEDAKRMAHYLVVSIDSCALTPRLRVGIVAYRDAGDTYVTREHPLTPSHEASWRSFLDALDAAGGGDWPKDLAAALTAAVDGMHWSYAPDAERLLVLLGDAPPHDVSVDGPIDVVARRASHKGVTIHSAALSPDATLEVVLRRVAEITGGSFLAADEHPLGKEVSDATSR